MGDLQHQTYNFDDIQVQFPYEAYECQKKMMEKIIKGVTTSQNCLLESPTGTGKTASLLCSLLAWQQDCKETENYCHDIIEKKANEMGGCSCGFIKDRAKVEKVETTFGRFVYQATTQFSKSKPAKNRKKLICSLPSSPAKYSGENSSPRKISASCPNTPIKRSIDLVAGSPSKSLSPFKRMRVDDSDDEEEEEESDEEATTKTVERTVENLCGYCVRKYVREHRPPKIYYCTRTHSQIAQVIAQLKKTAYRNVKMTILASREVTCLSDLSKREEERYQKMTSKEKMEKPKATINELCRKSARIFWKIQRLKKANNGVCDPKTKKELSKDLCKYYAPKWELRDIFTSFQATNGVWDLEDVKQKGESCTQCPYFACLSLHEDADIVFCPYNYLIDPNIRIQSDIRYANSVIVFDEAHNIEDLCRKAFSLGIDAKDLDDMKTRYFDPLIQKGSESRAKVSLATREKISKAADIIKKWSATIKKLGRQSPGLRNEGICKTFKSDKLLEGLNEIGITLKNINKCLNLIGQGDEEEEEEGEEENGDDLEDEEEKKEVYYDDKDIPHPFKVSSRVGDYLRKLRQILRYIFQKEEDGIGGPEDYSATITFRDNPKFNFNPCGSDDDGKLYKLEFSLLNPGLAFRTLKNAAYSIIVASGTLSPLKSFESELATTFKIKLQTEHVIPSENIFARVVGAGPRNLPLELNAFELNGKKVQDEIGNIICEICETVPNGILVFYPSYAAMNMLKKRWEKFPKKESVFEKIKKNKKVFFEESKDKELFKRNIKSFKEKAKGGSNYNGAIMFAVLRGKISEGVDFPDEQARAVVTIGIPYPNAGAAEVVTKREYNTMKERQNERDGVTFLDGWEWYETQAFRAMNQGLGRVVRHSQDWGALIMIDSRLKVRNKQALISGWIKNGVKNSKNFDELKRELSEFIRKMRRSSRDPIQIQYEEETTMDSESMSGESESSEEPESMSTEESESSANSSESFSN